MAKQSKPCRWEGGRCIFADHWAGCWEKGHEPQDIDDSKCPQTPGEVDALWENVCDQHIKRGRRNAR